MNTPENLEDDLFYFETDHLALRGNKDYSEILKTLYILYAEREQSIKNYNKVVEMKKEALQNPANILETLMKGESLKLPPMYHIPELPTINWSQYNVKMPDDSLNIIYSDKPEELNVKNIESEQKKSKASSGRWSTEEQKKLEELLQIYPPEPIEMRRFKKIADALGNRTIQQVTSRVQKYFLKLYKAGLPIPGRIPKSAEKYKRSSLHKHQRHNHYLWKPTTFFPDYCVPVEMHEFENVPGPSKKPDEFIPNYNDNYLLTNNLYNDSKESEKDIAARQLSLLKKVRDQKCSEVTKNKQQLFHHTGYKCDYCKDDPIIGGRWHCIVCENDSVDFCNDCVISQMFSDDSHPISHELVLLCDNNDNDNDNGNDKKCEPKSNSTSDIDSENEQFQSDNDNYINYNNQKNKNINNGSFNKYNNVDKEYQNDISNISYNYLHKNLQFDANDD